MKVVINRCYGGFGLSNEAFELLLQKKGIPFERVKSQFALHKDNWDYYIKGHAGDNSKYLSMYNFTEDRTNPDLIAIVEELGEASWGWAAQLAVIEIPDDVQFHIEEYDGMEHVAENHRTWG